MAGKIEWIAPLCVGLPARYEHASFIASAPSDDSVSGDQLYVFAGAKPEGPVNDMWRLNIGVPYNSIMYLLATHR